MKPKPQPENTQASPPATESASIQGDPVLAWTAHPLVRRPLVSIGVSAFIIAVALIVHYLMSSVGFALLALVALFASLAKFYFPTHYRLDKEGLTVKTRTQTLHKPWRLYRSVYPDKNGIFLSPFVNRTRLENFRGLYLMCEKNLDEVASFVKARIAEAQQVSVQQAGDGNET